MRGRTADRPSAVGGERQGRQPCGNRRGRAARRSARRAAEVPGIVGSAIERRFRRALAGELGAGSDAEEHGPRLLHAAHGQGALGRHKIPEEPRALGDAAALDPDIILHDEGYAEKRRRIAPGEAGVGLGRRGQRALGIDQHERPQLRIETSDASPDAIRPPRGPTCASRAGPGRGRPRWRAEAGLRPCLPLPAGPSSRRSGGPGGVLLEPMARDLEPPADPDVGPALACGRAGGRGPRRGPDGRAGACACRPTSSSAVLAPSS